jgi:ankyrin repeat protein
MTRPFDLFVILTTILGLFALVAVVGCGPSSQPVSPPELSFKNIFEAAEKGSVDDIRRFIEQGVDVNAQTGGRSTLLHYTGWPNSVEAVEYLTAQGVESKTKEHDGLMPLHWAAKDNPNVEVLEYLIAQGAEVNAKDNVGWTPLHYAAYSNSVEVLECLIAQGADVNARDDDGETPLDVVKPWSKAWAEAERAILREAGGKSGGEL